MNFANKLTLSRILLSPLTVLLILWEFPGHFWGAAAVFLIASITDIYDGNYARKHNLITDFGKLMDPLADKILIAGTLIAFTSLGLCSPWVMYIVIFREFYVTSLRLISKDGSGKVIAANVWGKLKTVSQTVAVISVMVFQEVQHGIKLGELLDITFDFTIIGEVFLWISAALTVISGMVYTMQNSEVIKNR